MLRYRRNGNGRQNPTGSTCSVVGNGYASAYANFAKYGSIVWLAVAIILLWIVPVGLCESNAEHVLQDVPDMSEAVKIGEELGIDVKKIMSDLLFGETDWKWMDIPAALNSAKRFIFEDLRMLASGLAVPFVMSFLMRTMLDRGKGASPVFNLICRGSCVSAVSVSLYTLSEIAADVMDGALRCSEAIMPAIVSASALVGQQFTGMGHTAAASVCSTLIQLYLKKWGLTLSISVAGIAIAGNLAERIRLSRLHGALRDLFQWSVGLLMVGYMGMLTIQGKLGSVRDGTGIRTAKFAIESIVPIIGGNVSDSLGSLIITGVTIKNIIGMVGIILVTTAALTPLLRIAGIVFALKLASALCEPFGDELQASMLSKSAEVGEMMLVAAGTASLLCALMMGSCLSTAGNVVQ